MTTRFDHDNLINVVWAIVVVIITAAITLLLALLAFNAKHHDDLTARYNWKQMQLCVAHSSPSECHAIIYRKG